MSPPIAGSPNGGSELKIALFIDLENVERGAEEAKLGKFSVPIVLDYLKDKGKLIVQKAYADWGRYSGYKFDFQDHGIEMIEMPSRRKGQKNMADIKMVVDALDLAVKWEYIDTFVIVSGDSDFTPLVSKLREYNRYLIGVGVKQSTSELIAASCDEFIYYDDLVRLVESKKIAQKIKDDPDGIFALLVDSVEALKRSGAAVILSSMIKQTMMRKRSDFDERRYGFRTFGKLLKAAQDRGLVQLGRDDKSGDWKILESE